MKITSIQQQAKRAGRYSVFVDGTFAFGISETGLIELGLHSGQELDEAQLWTLKAAAGIDRIYGNALRYVSLRPRSEWEMRTYLQRKGMDPPTTQRIVERLQHVNLLDDEAFAKSWVANRRLLKSISARKITLELQQKHINQDIIQKVMAGEDQFTDIQALRELIAKKRSRYPDQQKFMQYLARQGFSYDAIKSALPDV